MPHFVKIAADGSQLPAGANYHVAVLDTRTNLMWSASSSITALTEWKEAGKACAELKLASFNDWRLPTVEELFLLADRTKHNPTIDTAYFPDTKNFMYWSGTVDGLEPSCAWYVSFNRGDCKWFGAKYRAFVRAVRAASP